MRWVIVVPPTPLPPLSRGGGPNTDADSWTQGSTKKWTGAKRQTLENLGEKGTAATQEVGCGSVNGTE